MKNILVTGGNGQLGRSLQKIAAEYPMYRFIFTDLPDIDITDKALIENIVRESKVDCIINCAAYTQVDKAESKAEIAYEINADGPKILAETALENDIKLIHISTDYVFDGTASSPVKESDTTNPVGVYGKTKLAGEEAIRISGCDAIVIRTSWLYSEFGANFVKTMLRLAEERDTISVVNDQRGTPTYATDLALAIMALLERGGEGYDIYNFSDEGIVSWYDFAREIFRQAGIKINVVGIPASDYPTPAKRPAYSVLDKSKIKNTGIKVPDWKDSLAKCLQALGIKTTE